MPVIPDIYTDLEEHGLTVVGLCVEPRADGTKVSVEDVRAYLAARKVIANICDGYSLGAHSSVIANIIVHDAESTDVSPIAILGAEGSIGRGQSVEEFMLGLCHTLQAPLTIDDEARFDPGQREPQPVAPEDEPFDSSRALTVFLGSDARSAYTALLLSAGEGAFGITADHQIVVTERGIYPGPVDSGFHVDSVPTFTFVKSGRRRSLGLSLVPDEPPTLTINTSFQYLPILDVPWGSQAHKVLKLIEYGPGILQAEDLPKRPKKSASWNSDKRELFAAFEVFDSLVGEAYELTQVPPEQFFARVATIAQLPPEVISALQYFERQPDDVLPHALGSVRLTKVKALPEERMVRIRTVGAVQDALSRDPKHTNPTEIGVRAKKRAFRLPLAFKFAGWLILGLALATSAAIPAVANWLEFSTVNRIVVGVFSAGSLFNAALSAVSLGGRSTARKLLDQARADGVLPN